MSGKVFSRKLSEWLYWRISKRAIERVKSHGGRGTKSHVLKHSIEKQHVEVPQIDFKIIGSHFENITLKTKIAEALLIKRECPSSNVQEQLIELKLLD